MDVSCESAALIALHLVRKKGLHSTTERQYTSPAGDASKRFQPRADGYPEAASGPRLFEIQSGVCS